MMQRVIIVLFLAGALAGPVALAQTPTTETETYVGQVTGQDVNVRSGPSSTSYPCATISSPTKVSVLGSKAGWLKIVPPEGCFSIISKLDVTPDTAGKEATANRDHIWTRAWGYPTVAGKFTMLQRSMKKGEKVLIVGEVTDSERKTYYKIIPPKGSYVWIAPQFVKRVVDAPVPPAVTPPVTPPVETTTPPPVEPKVDPLRDKVTALDAELKAEYTKPARQMDFKAIQAKFEALEIPPDSDLKDYVQGRIQFVEWQVKDIETRKAVGAELQAMDEAHQRFLTELLKASMAVDKASLTAYSIKGFVMPSSIFAGNAAIRKRYYLMDADKLRIIAYLVKSIDTGELAAHVGKFVDVFGRLGYDKTVGLNMILVQKVMPRATQKPAPTPPMPTVGPVPVREVLGESSEETETEESSSDQSDEG